MLEKKDNVWGIPLHLDFSITPFRHNGKLEYFGVIIKQICEFEITVSLKLGSFC